MSERTMLWYQPSAQIESENRIAPPPWRSVTRTKECSASASSSELV
jgi:hypothetical protein